MSLDVHGIGMKFGGLEALRRIDLSVRDGELVAIIGPNGAGKSTLINIICGSYVPTSGRIEFRGEQISGLPPHIMNPLGIVRTFQTIELFRELTVHENVMAGGVAGTRCRGDAKPGSVAERIAVGAGAFTDGRRLPGTRGPRLAPRRPGLNPVRRSAAPVDHRPCAGERRGLALPGRARRGAQPGCEGEARRGHRASSTSRQDHRVRRTRHGIHRHDCAAHRRHRPGSGDRRRRTREDSLRRTRHLRLPRDRSGVGPIEAGEGRSDQLRSRRRPFSTFAI